MVWESIKEFFNHRTLTFPGKVSVLLLIAALAVAERYSDTLRNSRNYFVCNTNQPNKSFIEAECFDKYAQEYGDRFPANAFVFLWSFLAALPLYSSFASRHIRAVEHYKNDLNQMPQNRRRKMEGSCSVIVSYMIQLVLRVAILVVFTCSKLTLRPKSFPATYKCPLEPPVECKDNFYKENASLSEVAIVLSVVAFVSSLIELLHLITKCCWNRRRNNLKFICFLLDVDEAEQQEATQHLLEEDRQTIHQVPSTQATQHLLEEDQQTIPQVPSTQGYDYTELTVKLKRKFLATTENLEEILGEKLKTDTIFTKLLLQKGQHEHSLNFEKRTENLLSYTEDASTNIIEQVYQLFMPGEDHENPTLIFIIGRAGIGKTMFSTKLARDWASGTLFPHEEINNKYKFVFLFFFRQLNEIDEPSSLHDFLNLSHELDANEFEFVCKNPEQILIVMDGLDEFKDEAHVDSDRLVPLQEKQSIATICSQLLNRSVLEGATVVVTSRPESIPLIKFDRKAEILGFKPKDVEDYFKRFFGSKVENANLVLGHVKENANIAGLCYVPVNCFIICMYFQWYLENRDSSTEEYKFPSTITELYQDILKMFILKHHKMYKGQKYLDTPDLDVTPVLDELTKLSFELLQAKKYVFNQKDLRRVMGEKGKSEKVTESGIIHSIPGCRTGAISVETKYCFIHLTFQEFLAALFLVKKKNAYAFIQNAINQNLDVVIQFVSGLLRTASSSDKAHELLSFIVQKLMFKENFLLAIKCMFEFGCPLFAKQVVQQYDFTKLKLEVNDSDCGALAFILSLDVETNHKTKLLDLSLKSITCVRYVMDALKTTNCCTDSLNLSRCNIGDKGAKYIREGLSSGHCTLHSLNVSNNKIGAKGAKYVSEALSSGHCTLHSLNVSNNEIGAKGAKYVSEALSSGHCTLHSLNVSNNEIGAKGAKYVSEALSSGHCTLHSLNVSNNKIGAEGAKYVSEALYSGHCTLQSLVASYNNIHAKGAKYVSEALSSGNCTLQSLDISNNNIFGGAKYVREALNSTHCTLQQSDVKIYDKFIIFE